MGESLSKTKTFRDIHHDFEFSKCLLWTFLPHTVNADNCFFDFCCLTDRDKGRVAS